MRPPRLLILASLAGAALASLPPPAVAQISPGELSQAHADLDGSTSCAKCHSASKGVDGELCLACHTLLRQRIETGEGLHSRPEYRNCETCHIEHHSRQFELVWWGEEGTAAFDHGLTGEPLAGAHATLGCRDCHQAKHLGEPARWRAAGKDLDRTFLGLDPACLTCHADPHRQQFEADSCRSCHQLDAWRPAALFEHDRSSFPLTGRHLDVRCESCHPASAAEGEAAAGEAVGTVRYRGLAASSCADCHQDSHRGRMGGDCQSCHVTDGWHRVDVTTFDHGRTRFPLSGLHRSVRCDNCHRGTSMQIAGFERCDSCHADEHLGQFRDRAAGNACSDCHDTGGFRPARFTAEDHRLSSFPLVGSHRPVPCNDCHRPVPAASLMDRAGQPAGSPAAAETRQFRFASSDCVDCHRDPHAGEVTPYLGSDGCLGCHRISTWDEISFDHTRAGWPLEGRHGEVGCRECHAPAVDPGRDSREPELQPAEVREVRMKGLATTCESCHRDPHLGQFGVTGCTSCHRAESWKPAGFDHGRDSLFPLEGAHQKVACNGCHPVEQSQGVIYVRYKPLSRACSGCHGVIVR